MSVQPAGEVKTDRGVVADSFRALAVTSDRRTVLAALTEQAVAHFGRDHLMVSNVRVTSVVAAPANVSYLATGDFTIIS